MKRCLPQLVLTLLFAIPAIFASAQTEGSKIPLPEDVQRPNFSNSGAKSTSCAPDTILYPYLKELVFTAPNDSFFVDAMVGNVRMASQAYHINSPISIHGVQFWGGAYSTSIAPQTLAVRAYLYSVDGMNMPLEKIDSADVVITNEYDFYEAVFSTPVVHGENFAVAVKSIPNDTLAVITNNAGSGWQVPNYSEGLGWRRFGSGAWNSSLSFFGQDLEYMIFPIVSYDISTEFTAEETTVCEGNSIEFTNSSSELFSERMFNLYSFDEYWGFAEADSSFTWSANDTSVNSPVGSSFTFDNAGDNTVSLTGNFMGYYGSCSETYEMEITVLEEVIAGVEALGVTEFCEGGSVNLAATPATAESFIWLYNGNPVEGANADTFEAFEAGNYSVVVSNMCNTDTAEAVTVNINFAPEVPVISGGGSLTFCEGGFVALSVDPQPEVTYQWFFNNEVLEDSTGESIFTIQSGNFSILATNECGSVMSEDLTVVVNPLPQIPVIVLNGNTLEVDPSTIDPDVTFQWYFNENLIADAVSANYNPEESGDYTVMVMNENGCSSHSEIFHFSSVGMGKLDNAFSFSVFPNPTKGMFTISLEGIITAKINITVFDILGQEIFSSEMEGHHRAQSFDLSGYNSGMYIIHIGNAGSVANYRLILQ